VAEATLAPYRSSGREAEGDEDGPCLLASESRCCCHLGANRWSVSLDGVVWRSSSPSPWCCRKETNVAATGTWAYGDSWTSVVSSGEDRQRRHRVRGVETGRPGLYRPALNGGLGLGDVPHIHHRSPWGGGRRIGARPHPPTGLGRRDGGWMTGEHRG